MIRIPIAGGRSIIPYDCTSWVPVIYAMSHAQDTDTSAETLSGVLSRIMQNDGLPYI